MARRMHLGQSEADTLVKTSSFLDYAPQKLFTR